MFSPRRFISTQYAFNAAESAASLPGGDGVRGEHGALDQVQEGVQ